jgi:GTPase SAR1 family protein
MTIKIKKPILIAGVSLSFLLWFWQIISSSLSNLGESSLWILMGIALLFGFFPSKKNKSQSLVNTYQLVTKSQLDQVFTDIEKLGKKLAEESQGNNSYEEDITKLKTELNREELQVAILGTKKVGKSSLKEILETKNIATNLNYIEIDPCLDNFSETDTTENNLSLLKSDLLLFLINGDLADSEWQIIKQLNSDYHRMLLIFNKKDLFSSDEQAIILKQIKSRVEPIIIQEDLIAISTNPREIKVKKYQENGLFKEWLEKPQPDLNLLLNHLQEIVTNHQEQLILATTYRQGNSLKNSLKQKLNEHRKKRALPIIEQYQWIAAGTAFANPVSSLDLLATAAINTQMLIDLGSIYQQKLSLEQAKTASVSIAKLIVKLGLVEISTQTIGSMLKSNVVTYVAGGVVQGVSSAYLTRIVGLSLIEYFQIQEININPNNLSLNLDKFKQKIQTIFQENQKTVFLQNFVKTAMVKFANS